MSCTKHSERESVSYIIAGDIQVSSSIRLHGNITAAVLGSGPLKHKKEYMGINDAIDKQHASSTVFLQYR
jgi:hypothetical protein